MGESRLVQTPHATPKVVIATTDLQRLHDQLEFQQDALARQALLIAALLATWRATLEPPTV
jgi:hypothetical protein